MQKLNLKRFLVKNKDKFVCELDGKEFPLKLKSFVKILLWNGSRHYKGSGLPIRSNYKIVCCPKCFVKLQAKVNQILF